MTLHERRRPALRGAWAAALALVLLATSFAAAAAPSGPHVTVTVDPATPGATISPDFIGLSFEIEKLLADADGKRYFSPENKALVATLRALGVKSLRVGGNTADRPTVKLPSEADIDSLFAFARAVDAKVIYTLRLREGSRETAAATARYIQEHHAADLTCFAIGNEPNVFAKVYSQYLEEWRRYVAAVTAPGVAPAARFCGPSATPGKVDWAATFVNDVADQVPLAVVTQHSYPGESGRKVTDPAAARRLMLSTTWTDGYATFRDAFVPAVAAHKLPYRLEEANSYFHGGAKDVSNTLASALWALDYMYWWAAHGAAGINFHTGDEVAAGDQNTPCWYASFWTSPGGYDVHPIGHALKVFDLGSHGRLVPATVAPAVPAADPLAAYAVVGEDALFVTLVHKAVDGAPVGVTIDAGRAYKKGAAMFLRGPSDSATTGVTVGGAAITEDGGWKGEWTPLKNGLTVTLPPATAAVVRVER